MLQRDGVSPQGKGLARPVTRRDFVRGAAAVTFLGMSGVLSACADEVASSPKETAEKRSPLRIGYLPILDASPLLIAHAKGLYEQAGIEAEKPVLMRNWASLSEAFMSGQVDLAHFLSPIPIFMRYNLNFPVKVIAFDHVNGSGITVKDESDIKDIADLAGKKIGIPHFYSVHNVLLQYALRDNGIEPVIESDVKRITSKQAALTLKMPPDKPTALAEGSIDPNIVAEPFNAAGELLAGGRVLRFTGDMWKDHACCQAVLNEKAIEKDRVWAQAVTAAVVAGEAWTLENPDEAASILSKEGAGYLPMPEKVISHAMSSYDVAKYGPEGTGAIQHPEWNAKRISFNPQMYRSYTVKLVELLKQTKVEGDSAFLASLDGETVADELFDYALLDEALAKAGGLERFSIDGQVATETREEIIEI
ncbi:MAG: ABC transporter substrate-binding protein [Gemmatimonadaceae bacterium]|nr:ABC transporter substrate-binding protein [Gemmatimonadaceae bacterium]